MFGLGEKKPTLHGNTRLTKEGTSYFGSRNRLVYVEKTLQQVNKRKKQVSMESYYIKNILENNINKEKLYENITFQQVDIVHLSYQHYYVLCIIPM